MKNRFLIQLLFVGALTTICKAQTMPHFIVANKPSQKVEIIPVDPAGEAQAPAELATVIDRVPPGSFLLKNNTSEPITAVITTWDYVNAVGQPQQARLNCDAYLGAPLDPIVHAHESALISPYACANQRVFGHVVSGGVLGSPLESGPNKFTPDLTSPIHIYLDSIIFENGDVWGPDNLHYYTVIQERHSAIERFIAEVATARASGTDLNLTLAQIEESASARREPGQARRTYYAKLLRASPNPEATLEQLRHHPLPPTFHNIGEL